MEKYRLDLTKENFTKLELLLKNSADEDLIRELKKVKIIKVSDKKIIASQKATKQRSENAKAKIENAINILRLTGKKITVNSVANESGVHYNTASKYKDFIRDNSN